MTAMQSQAVHGSALLGRPWHCKALRGNAVPSPALRGMALLGDPMQCSAVRCTPVPCKALQVGALHGNPLQCTALPSTTLLSMTRFRSRVTVSQGTARESNAMLCNPLQYPARPCTALQCAAFQGFAPV